jgi:hypothetical protein
MVQRVKRAERLRRQRDRESDAIRNIDAYYLPLIARADELCERVRRLMAECSTESESNSK